MMEAGQRQVPQFVEREFSPRRSDYCAAVFVINEGQRLHTQLDRMRSVAESVDVVIADGGSEDGSTDVDRLAAAGVNTLLVKTGPGKLGAQMRMAFAWALDRGYKGVVVIDGNNKDSAEDIPRFVDKLREGYDHVQGSRFIPGGRHENTPRGRLLGLKLLHAPMIRLASGFPYTDTTNGFRAYSARFLADRRVAVFRDIFVGYELHYYLAIRACRLGYRVIEIPVRRVYPAGVKPPTKISPLRGNLKVIRCLLAACFHRYDPPMNGRLAS
jgi:dolichol-phosphate mannosyltransferase